jgi:hypothetical protein
LLQANGIAALHLNLEKRLCLLKTEYDDLPSLVLKRGYKSLKQCNFGAKAVERKKSINLANARNCQIFVAKFK